MYVWLSRLELLQRVSQTLMLPLHYNHRRIDRARTCTIPMTQTWWDTNFSTILYKIEPRQRFELWKISQYFCRAPPLTTQEPWHITKNPQPKGRGLNKVFNTLIRIYHFLPCKKDAIDREYVGTFYSWCKDTTLILYFKEIFPSSIKSAINGLAQSPTINKMLYHFLKLTFIILVIYILHKGKYFINMNQVKIQKFFKKYNRFFKSGSYGHRTHLIIFCAKEVNTPSISSP